MLKRLKPLASWLLGRDEIDRQEPVDWANRRVDERHNVIGRDVRLRSGGLEYRMHLKDLSCSGASGLTDAPLGTREPVLLEIEKGSFARAEVRWTRGGAVGLKFEEPIDQAFVLLFRSLPQKPKKQTKR